MEIFSIGSAQPISDVRADLEHELSALAAPGLSVRFLENSHGVYSFVECQFDQEGGGGQEENQGRILRCYIANVITDLILNNITHGMLRRIIHGQYRYFNEKEQDTIAADAAAILNAQNTNEEIPHRIWRRNQILAKILKYLENHHQLVLEGFVRFQLKDYLREMKEAAERSVDRFMLEHEYEEFIKLLRYFVDIQPPRIEEVNVRVKGGGMFSLLDEEGMPIEHEQLRSILSDFGPEEIDYEDLLLSALITISPARVVLHIIDHLEVVDTIRRVFAERVVICPGCRICRESDPPPKFEH